MKQIKLKTTFALLALMEVSSISSGKTNQVNKNSTERPNILWITCEDISPYLGSYGCREAQTPSLDRLAKKGIRFTNAYANAPVCAVARATILSGMYATTTGTHQMRSNIQLPPEIPAYPKILREAGYYCTNNSKKDYNSNYENDGSLWDESSNNAHYRNRKTDQPFFAVFNITVTHESQLNKDLISRYIERKQIPVEPRIHPADIKLPPYQPDLPEIREDWSRLHDLITLMDKMAGDLIQELEDQGLADNTIIFFNSDHGGQLARSKRYIYNVGTQVPFIVHLPEKWQHLAKERPGDTYNSMVSFVDFAKTFLSITGCETPVKMQGRIFLGTEKEKAPDFVHFYRDRMAERYDFSRAVTDRHYYFVRNFMPHRPAGRDSRYGYEVQANWRAWEDWYDKGGCNEIQSQFYQPKPAHELFDTKKDPWHIVNLSNQPKYQKRVKELSDEVDRWMIETRDVGLIPEPMFHDLIGKNKEYKTLYDYAQSDNYPVGQILDVAKAASSGEQEKLSMYLSLMKSSHPIIRYWATYGIFILRSKDMEVQAALKERIKRDDIAANRIMAAQALGLCGDPDRAFTALIKEVNETDQGYVLLQALNAFQYSHTDNLLTLNDWERFKEKKFPEGDVGSGFGYPQRIIDDALKLWPKRRIVD